MSPPQDDQEDSRHPWAPGEQAVRDLFGVVEEVLDLALSRLERNDRGNADRLIRRYGKDLIYVTEPAGSVDWYAWCGTHWLRDPGPRQAAIWASETARAIKQEAAAAESQGVLVDKTDTPIESDKDFAKRIDSLRNWGTSSNNAGKIEGMLKMAAPHLARGRDQLDTNFFLLNVANGTLELRGADDNGPVLRPARRKDLITRVAPINYDPRAQCPKFLEWLTFIQPDPEVRLLLQQIFGYCLTGSGAAQIVPAFYGEGANGKSTLMNVARDILGPYAQSLPVASLLENEYERGSEATPDIARLPGVRLAMASEPRKGARISLTASETRRWAVWREIRSLRAISSWVLPAMK